MRTEDEGIFVSPGAGKALPNPIGRRMVVKVRDEDTGGGYSIHDNTIPPGSPGAPASHPPPPRGGLLRPGRGADRAGGDTQDHGSSGLVRGDAARSRPPALDPGDGADQSVAHLLPRRDGSVFRRGSRRAHAAAGSPDRSGGPGEAHGLCREVRLRVRGAPATAVARISARSGFASACQHVAGFAGRLVSISAFCFGGRAPGFLPGSITSRIAVVLHYYLVG